MATPIEAQQELFDLQRAALAVSKGGGRPTHTANLREKFIQQHFGSIHLNDSQYKLLESLTAACPAKPFFLPEPVSESKTIVLDLATVLIKETGFQIHYVRPFRNKGKGVFISGENWLDGENRRIMNLLGAGFTTEKTSTLMDKKLTYVAEHLQTQINPWLGVRSSLQAVVLLARHHQLDTDILTQQIGIERFGSLPDRHVRLMDSLIGNGGRSNAEIVSNASVRLKEVTSGLNRIGSKVSFAGSCNRIALAVGYMLYRKEQADQSAANLSASA